MHRLPTQLPALIKEKVGSGLGIKDREGETEAQTEAGMGQKREGHAPTAEATDGAARAGLQAAVPQPGAPPAGSAWPEGPVLGTASSFWVPVP